MRTRIAIFGSIVRVLFLLKHANTELGFEPLYSAHLKKLQWLFLVFKLQWTDSRYFPGGGGTPSRPSKPPEKQHSPTAPLHNVNPESFTAFTTNSILLEDYRVSEDIPPGFEGQKSAKGIFSQ